MSSIESIIQDHPTTNDGERYIGTLIKLNDGDEISLYITRFSICCETWGWYVTDDISNFQLTRDYSGADVTGVEWHGLGQIQDKSLLCEDHPLLAEECNNACIEVKTTMGVLYLVVWCAHNGYYPHSYIARWSGYEDVGLV